jgi:hypothetical protein
MIVNKLDKRVSEIFSSAASASQTIEDLRALLEGLCEELKQLWDKKGKMENLLVKDLIENCLHLVTRPLEESEDWDEYQAEPLILLWNMGATSTEFRNAVNWARSSRDPKIRILLVKVEREEQMFFLNESLEHLEGMAHSLLTWLNARNTLIHAYRNR